MKLNRDVLRKLPLALRVEIEENAQRKALTQSELAAAQKRILDELRKYKAPGTRNDLKGREATSGKALPQVHATGIVGKLFNESRVQVEKRLAVVDAADADRKKFGKLVEAMDATGRVDRAFKQLKIIRRQEEHAKRTEVGCTVDDLVKLAASGKRFSVIYADPPWPFDGGGMSRADHHYGTSPITDIMNLPVAALAADDCALLMWTTSPHVAVASHTKIIEAWGFRPSTVAFVWVKQNKTDGKVRTRGQSHWTIGATEHVILGIKGSPTRLAFDIHQVVMIPVGEHSAKPEQVRGRIERLSPVPTSNFTRASRSPDGLFGATKFHASSSRRPIRSKWRRQNDRTLLYAPVRGHSQKPRVL